MIFFIWVLGLLNEFRPASPAALVLFLFPFPVCLAILSLCLCSFLSLVSSHPNPPCVFLSFSQHALFLCTSYQHVSLSASRCLRQAFQSRKLLQLQSCLLFSIHLSVPLSQGFVLFSTAINLLANRQQSRRLGVGIRFLAQRPPKNAGA